MNTLLNDLYDLLSCITEDAVAHGFTKDVPPDIMKMLNDCCVRLGEYLDGVDPLSRGL
jgi:hypothetical protein